MTIEHKTRTWDAVEKLDTEEDVVAYLEAALDDGDPAFLGAAPGDTASHKSVAQIARYWFESRVIFPKRSHLVASHKLQLFATSSTDFLG
jgi:hypothetical protein